MQNSIHIFPDTNEAALSVAQLIAKKASEKQKLGNYFNLAISGGNTPKLLFDIISTQFCSCINWTKVRIFWVDERCVAPTHPESNYGMTLQSLLKNIAIPEDNIFRMRGEDAPEVEALRYEQLLRDVLPLSYKVPLLDLALLGMGDDGHTASIFPHQMQLLNSSKLVAVGTHPVTGQQRITLTGRMLTNASELLFLITGNSKACILNEVLTTKANYLQLPTYHIVAQHNNVHFYLDNAAASELEK